MDKTVLVLNTSQPVPELGVWHQDDYFSGHEINSGHEVNKVQWLYRHNAHNQTSHTVLFEGLQLSGLNPQEITDIIICLGPGSYTGLRTGVSLVQTLLLTLPSIKVWPVTQFQLVNAQPGWVILPALRQTAYVAKLNSLNQIADPQSVDLTTWHPDDNLTWSAHAKTTPYLTRPANTLAENPDVQANAITLWQQGVLKPALNIQPLYIHPPRITLPKIS